MKKLKVNNCEDCPLKYMSGYEGEEYTCSIDKNKRKVYFRNTINHIDSIKMKDKKKWCPLNDDDYTIDLIK